MFVDFEITTEDRIERLSAALAALAALDQEPQERLDRALSLFRRAFKGEPPAGPVCDAFRRIWVAIGDPPYGTWPGAHLATLSPEEQQAIVAGLVELYAAVVREAGVARAAA
ncbi:MAG: hypothetical protein KIT14_05545 [bacterium]|nr:hypothetical protein [bacterium]